MEAQLDLFPEVKQEEFTRALFFRLIHFITRYRSFEKLTYSEADRQIEYLFKGEPGLARHLVNHWHSKKKSFGQFFLNLDTGNQILFQQLWGIIDPEDQQYMEEVDGTIAAYHPSSRPLTNRFCHNILLFFNNHGICAQPAAGIRLENLPKASKCFGNSANWGDYILSLSSADQEELLRELAIYQS